jgi:putative transposase
MARPPNPQLHAIWRERIRRQQASGLTIEQFCSQEGIARSKFHAWKRRFRLADTTDRCPAFLSPSSFLPVTVRLLQHGPAEPPPIEAELPNGVRLRIPTGDPHLACRVIRTVAAAKTNSGGTR